MDCIDNEIFFMDEKKISLKEKEIMIKFENG